VRRERSCEHVAISAPTSDCREVELIRFWVSWAARERQRLPVAAPRSELEARQVGGE
jgi:hypothetical protein